MSPHSRCLSGLLCGLMLANIGCTTLNIPFLKDRMPKATARNPVSQIVCIWEPSEGRDPDGRPCRGVAGQILFLAGRGSMPVQMEGDVRIYVFDDQGSLEDQSKPLHQFDFDSVSWSRHLTKGTLGPTYSVFVPYTRRGTQEANVALRVRLTTEDSPAVFSDLASVPLGGNKKTDKKEAELEAAFDEAKAASEANAQAMRRTTTISLNGTAATPKPRVTADSAVTQAVASGKPSRAVQQAAYEEDAAPVDPNAQRVEELEQLVRQLLDQQQTSARPKASVKQAAAQIETAAPPRLLPDETPPAGRFRLKQAATEQLSEQETGDKSPESGVRRQKTEVGRAATGKAASPASHPLDDSASSVHPLEELDAEDVSPSRRTRSRSSDNARSAHPLTGLEGE